MDCATCSAETVETQRAAVAAAEASIEREFGAAMTERRNTEAVVIDEARMKDAWADVRTKVILERGATRSVTVGRDREVRKIPYAERDVRALVKRASDETFGGAPLMAFAFRDSIYISPETSSEVVSHELLHGKLHPDSMGWLMESVGRDDLPTINRFNESITEHFNSQLDTHPPSASPFGPPEYRRGPSVVQELRDERLGGAEHGEQLLREWYFGGNGKPLQEQMERGPGGVRGFFEDYNARIDGTRGSQ